MIIDPSEQRPETLLQKAAFVIDAVKNGDTAPVPSSQIFKNQAILDGIVKSAEFGREVEVAMPEMQKTKWD